MIKLKRTQNAKIINKCSRYQILRYQENLLFLGKLSFKENLLLFFSLSIIFKLDGPGDYLHATKWIFHSKKKWKVEICSSLCWFEGFGGASVAVFGSVLATWHPYLFFLKGQILQITPHWTNTMVNNAAGKNLASRDYILSTSFRRSWNYVVLLN